MHPLEGQGVDLVDPTESVAAYPGRALHREIRSASFGEKKRGESSAEGIVPGIDRPGRPELYYGYMQDACKDERETGESRGTAILIWRNFQK